MSELEYYKAIIDKFREKYGCPLEELEERIERESRRGTRNLGGQH